MPIRLPEAASCYFCEIIRSAEAWNVVERSALTITLLNGRQFEAGQCLVIPIRHAPTLLDLDDAEAAAVMSAAQRASRALVDAFDPDGILLYQNNGVGSGQEVPHFHVHVVPRRAGSDWGFGPPHLERIERGLAHLDYRSVTDIKRQTADIIRRHLR